MSYDESDEDGEWEVIDIIHTATSVKTNKKSKPAKQADVDKLAHDIQTQLSLKSTYDTQQMLLLEQKMKQQQQLSEQQLRTIQHKLNEITAVQQVQNQQQKDLDQQRADFATKQKQQLLEQQIQIQSLSDHQMLTQKQIVEAHQQIQQTQQVTANVNENIQSLQQIQQQQQLQQQMTEQQLQQQLHEQTQQLQTQTQLAQLAQIAAQQHVQQQQFNQVPVVPQLGTGMFNVPPPQVNMPQIQAQVNEQVNGNVNGKNSWLPSFFAFGKNNNNNNNGGRNIGVQDMDMASTPPANTNTNSNLRSGGGVVLNQEEKEPILMDDDDDDVLRWHNDYGSNPLYNNPGLLKTKAVIGEGKFAPGEKRQCGWILVNKSTNLMKLSAVLECIGGDKQDYGIKIVTEKIYEFSLKPNEEMYLLIEVEAPPMVGKYCAFYQLVIDNGVKIGEMLEVMCHVTAQFSAKKEQKIAQIIKMGFNERKKVIATLQKKKWNVQQSVDTLIGL